MAAAAPLVGSRPGGSSASAITTLSFLACAPAGCGSRESAAKMAAAVKANFLDMQTLLNGTDRIVRQTKFFAPHYHASPARRGSAMIVSAWWHAAEWPGPTLRTTGATAPQCASAKGHLPA